MRAVVVGATAVGSCIAQRLSDRDHVVVVVDPDPDRIQWIETRLGVDGWCGDGAGAATLARVGIGEAGLAVAATDQDEVNLVSCALAKHAGVPQTVARLRSGNWGAPWIGPVLDRLGVDLVIDPEEDTARAILDLIRHRGTAEVAIVFLGGSPLTERIVAGLHDRFRKVTIIERDPVRATELAGHLDHALVVHGDPTDPAVLAGADIGHTDMLVALTGDADADALACLSARSAGAKATLVVVPRVALLGVTERLPLDAVLCPPEISADRVLRSIGDAAPAVAALPAGTLEVLHHQVAPGSRADGAAIADLGLPAGALVAAVVRGRDVEIGRGTTVLRAHDRLVVVGSPGAAAEADEMLATPGSVPAGETT